MLEMLVGLSVAHAIPYEYENEERPGIQVGEAGRARGIGHAAAAAADATAACPPGAASLPAVSAPVVTALGIRPGS